MKNAPKTFRPEPGWLQKGIRFNAICPGPVETAMTLANMKADRVLGFFRFGQPGEIAAAALFLEPDDASFVAGAALPVDGGYAA